MLRLKKCLVLYNYFYRTATLEDIQRQVKDSNRKNITVQRRIMNPSRKSTLVSYFNDDDSDDGDITGYANNVSHYICLVKHMSAIIIISH